MPNSQAPTDRWHPSSVIYCMLIVASVGCTAQERDLNALMQAGQTNTGGSTGTANVGGSSATSSAVAIGGYENQGGATGLGGFGGSAGGTLGSSVTAIGGATVSGGATNSGGSGSVLGGSASTAGSSSGGTVSVMGGTTGNGGSANGGVTSSTVNTGGTMNTGGTLNVGGTESFGGAESTGGTESTGGSVNAGGNVSTGGDVSTGGSVSIGGSVSTGGNVSTGGSVSTGGNLSTGGTTAVVGPSVVVSYGSVADGGTTNLTTANFTFTSTPSGAVKFECSLNSTSNYADCTSSISLTALSAGTQQLHIRAYNGNNVVGPVLTRTWTVTSRATTIKTIRGGTIPVDTLVSISTNVRLTGMYTVSTNNQVIFVQEADYSGSSVETVANLTGNLVLNSGILTRPLSAAETARSAGTGVTVTGTIKNNQNNLELVRSTYAWGSGNSAYNPVLIRTGDVIGESLEGVYISLAGQTYAPNCSTACNNTGGNNCFEACSGSCNPLTWTQIAGTTPTSRASWWQGFLVQTGSYYTLWVVESNEQNDACL